MRCNTCKLLRTMSLKAWVSITAILRLVLEHSDDAHAEMYRRRLLVLQDQGLSPSPDLPQDPSFNLKCIDLCHPEKRNLEEALHHRNGIFCEVWIGWCCLGSQAHSLLHFVSAGEGSQIYSFSEGFSQGSPITHQKTMAGRETVRMCVDHLIQHHFAKVKRWTGGSPTISFQDPHHTPKATEKGRPGGSVY